MPARRAEGRAPKPNRLAHRWVKGPQGWIPSIVASEGWNDNGEAEAGTTSDELEQGLLPQGTAVVDMPLSD